MSKSRRICARGTAANRSSSTTLTSDNRCFHSWQQIRPQASMVATRASVMSSTKFPGGSGAAISARSADRVRLKSIMWNLASIECVDQDCCDTVFRVEMGFRQLAGRLTMMFVVSIDSLERVVAMAVQADPKHARAVGQEAAGAGVLHPHRLAA